MIIKPVSVSEDIQPTSAANGTILSNTLIRIVNTNNAHVGVNIAETLPKIVYIPPNESIVIEKEHGSVIDVPPDQPGITTHVWAQAVAYTN